MTDKKHFNTLASGKQYVLKVQVEDKAIVTLSSMQRTDVPIQFSYLVLFSAYQPKEIFSSDIENGVNGWILKIKEGRPVASGVCLTIDQDGIMVYSDARSMPVVDYYEYDGSDVTSRGKYGLTWANDEFCKDKQLLNALKIGG